LCCLNGLSFCWDRRACTFIFIRAILEFSCQDAVLVVMCDIVFISFLMIFITYLHSFHYFSHHLKYVFRSHTYLSSESEIYFPFFVFCFFSADLIWHCALCIFNYLCNCMYTHISEGGLLLTFWLD
jgi:hypothetical protein